MPFDDIENAGGDPTKRGRASRTSTRKAPRRKGRPPTRVVGWREWVALPDLGIERIKVKIDTGARSSTIHAYDIRRFKRKGTSMLRFKIHPVQRETRSVVEAEAQLLDMRKVRSSSGTQTLRPVIVTALVLADVRWDIELTLIRRDEMGFRMLLGRQAVRHRFLVDPGGSFLAGRNAVGGPS